VAGARDVAGRRYALALIAIAQQDGTLDTWGEAVDGLDALTEQPSYVDALQADGMTDEQFQAIVRRVLPDIGPKQMNLLRLLRSKRRLALGPSIASFYRELWDEQRNVLRATVTTAVELDGERRAAVAGRLADQTGKQIELETQVDSMILGGAIIRYGDSMVDGSTRTRLRNLRGELERAGR
jgi:F-type H+-transporting ATPase subunit delta